MPEIKWKDLYVATNIDELQKHAAAPMDERLNKKECLPNRLYRILDKCLDKYKEFEKQNDLEYMYVYLFKYLQLLTYLQDNADDKKYFKCRVGTEPHSVLQKFEKLHKFLSERYQESENRKALNNGSHLKVNDEVNPSDDAIQNLKNKQNDDFSSQKKLKSNDDDFGVNFNSDFIDCKTLKSLIGKNSPSVLLIMDVRTENDYSCRIIGTNNIINIPPEIIKKGVSANELRKELPENSKNLWDKRGKFDCIVLADADTDQHTFNSDTPVHILRAILTEWDYPREVKNKPLVLLGGICTWFDLYSFDVTMPSLMKLMKSTKAPPKTPVIELDDIEYPDSDEESKRKDVIMKGTPNENALTIVSPIPHTVLNTVIPPTPSPPPPSAAATASSTTTTINSQSSSGSVPRFDRSVKPNLERKPSFDKSTPRKPFESITDVHKRHINKPNENILSKLYNQDEDDDYRPFSPNLSSVSTNKENQSSILNTTIESSKSNLRKNDIGTEHVPLKFDGNTSGSTLKKSLSSPNINKADDNMAVHVPKTPPTCDRTKKPISVPPSDSPQNGIQDKQYRTQGELEGAVVGVNVSRGLTGLKNLGNSCYMNSILQCISNTTELRQELCKFCPGAIKNNQKSKTDGVIAREVERVIRTLWYGNIKYFSCVDLKSVVGRFRSSFKGFEQQDSHEFFTILMDWLHEDLNEPSPKGELLGAVEETGEKAWGEFKKNNSSIVQNLFYGQQKSTVKCDHCGKQSVTFEPFSNLSLLLPNNKDSCTLSECLCLYLREETINGWNCPDCKTARNATKKVDITRLPPVLVIHLKRFTSNGWCRKKQTFVDFPLESLNMKQYTVHGSEQRNEMFNLYAISNHYGTMESGHYTAYCYNAELNRWFKFDDQEVTDISPSDVRTSAAYILFYSALKR